MYIRIARGTTDPSRLDDVVAVLRDVGHPLMRQQAGFQNSSIGVNRTNGQVVIVSTWDTEEHASVSFAGATDFISRLQALGVDFGQQPGPALYEVAYQV